MKKKLDYYIVYKKSFCKKLVINFISYNQKPWKMGQMITIQIIIRTATLDFYSHTVLIIVWRNEIGVILHG